MLDINGQELNVGDEVQILCEVIAIDASEGVRVRILNSEQELLISCSQDEVLGLHASPELTKFEGAPGPLAPDLAISESEDYEKSPAGIAARMADVILGQDPEHA